MTPGARVAAAIEILDTWRESETPLDRLLTAWGRAHRFAGSGDRHAIADHVYAALRRLRSAGSRAGAAGNPAEITGRQAMIGSCLLDGTDPDRLFTGEGHAPPPLGEGERAAIRDGAQTPPEGVALDMPDWLMPYLAGVPREAILALRHRAPLDLRVNRLKTEPEVAAERLAGEGIGTVPGPLSPDCLRVTEGARKVARSAAFAEGLVEIQDAASQAAARHAGARPGETVVDFCAGGGGKTLALALAMQGQGRLVAHDISADRLEALIPRAARAGVAVETRGPGETDDLAGRCDLVFVDAPCSGSGAWRRNPDAKWRLDAARLEELCALQGEVLASAARAVRPGGRLIYATCSILEAENAAQVARFLSNNPDFHADGEALTLLPGDAAGDGFFAARLRRDDEAPAVAP